MSRPLRIEFPLAYYHIVNRGLAYPAVCTERTDCEGGLHKETGLPLLPEGVALAFDVQGGGMVEQLVTLGGAREDE